MKQLDIILHALKIDGKCVGYDEHRHMAFYDVELRPGTPINRLERRTREIALSLRSKTVPIVKLLPKQGVVRLQVANTDADILPIEKLFENVSMPSENICILPFVLGETDEGFQLWVDLAKHPHTWKRV